MTSAVTETARAINPLTISISNGIMRSIDFVIDRMSRVRLSNRKTVEQLAYSLRVEYPKESDEYVMNMAIDLLKDAR
jgi:hypothetical protein